VDPTTLLINAPYHGIRTKGTMPPLGLLTIASCLEKNGVDVEFLDLYNKQEPEKELIKQLKVKDYEYVGISFATPNRFEAFDAAKHVKSVQPNAKVIVGGVHATFTAKDILKHITSVDFVVRGEGEQTTLDLVSGKDPNDIQGIDYRKGDKIIHNPPRPFIKSLDILPLPAYHLINMKEYNPELNLLEIENPKTAHIMTMRGCPYNCVFCSATTMWGRHFRGLSPKRIMEWIKFLADEYHVNALYITDETLTIDRKRVTELCYLLKKEQLDLKWMVDIRVDEISRSSLKLMRDAGAYLVAFGVESGVPRILKNINKNIRLDQVEKIVDCSKEIGLKTKGFFMMGNPGESKDDVRQTFKFMDVLTSKGLNLAILATALIFPGTQLESIAKERGYLSKNFSWSKYYFEPFNKQIFTYPTVPIFEQDILNRFDILQLWRERNSIHSNMIRGIRRIKNVKNIKDFRDLTNLGTAYFRFYLRNYL